MILDLYVILFITDFFLFFIGLTDLLKLNRETRMTIMMISGIMFFVLAMTSFNLENTFCSYSSSWQCTTQSMNDVSLAIMNIGFGVLSMLYILTEALGWLPKEVKEGVNLE